MKNFPLGMKIVVVTELNELIKARVTRSGKRSIIKYRQQSTKTLRRSGFGPKRLRSWDEGILWARGWDGPAVDALRAEAMLRRSST